MGKWRNGKRPEASESVQGYSGSRGQWTIVYVGSIPTFLTKKLTKTTMTFNSIYYGILLSALALGVLGLGFAILGFGIAVYNSGACNF